MRWARILHEGQPRFAVIGEERADLVDGTPFGEHRPSGEHLPLEGLNWLAPALPANVGA